MKIGISHILDSPGNSRSYFHSFPKGLSGPHCHTSSHRGILSHLTLAQETQILEGSPSAIYFLHNVLTVLNPLTSPPVNCTGQGVHIQIQMFSVEVRTAWSRQHADTPVSVGPGRLTVEGMTASAGPTWQLFKSPETSQRSGNCPHLQEKKCQGTLRRLTCGAVGRTFSSAPT